jgi:hypothetical protein
VCIGVEAYHLVMLTNRSSGEIERLRYDCAEAYQVIGQLAANADLLGHPSVAKALDNLSAAAQGDPRPHDNLLPFSLESP